MSVGTIRVLAYILLCFQLGACAPSLYNHQEFRGAWVASVKNIDWPSQPTTSREQLLGEFRRTAAFYESLNFNALVVQIRPAADALYRSEIEPWSEWYSGKQGQGIAFDEDLLPILIEESHSRGLEFHAWLNPYRAVIDADSAYVDSLHVALRHPDWLVRYGDNLYFDPGIPAARKHVLSVVADIVSRYDVDAIHFDDYFYPYKIDTLQFPDTLSFKMYGDGFADVEDWRRDNVNKLVRELSDTIKSIKPYVKFGISPFGVWRNIDKDSTGSATRAGQTNYDDLYADVLLWQKEGWLDYLAPQIYWEIGFDLADYEILTEWWSTHDYGRDLYIGQAASRINRWDRMEEMGDHLRMVESYPSIEGNIFFSAKSLYSNPKGFADTLRTDFYQWPATTPAMPWMDGKVPVTPTQVVLSGSSAGQLVSWQADTSANVKEYLVLRSHRQITAENIDKSHMIARVRHPECFYLDAAYKKHRKYFYAVVAVSRVGVLSEISGNVKKAYFK